MARSMSAAEAMVARDRAGADAEGAVGLPAEREDGDVAGTAAEVDDHRLGLFGDAVERGLSLAGDEVEERRERLVEQVAVAEREPGEVGGEQGVFALRDLERRWHGHDRPGDRSGRLVAQEAEDLAGHLGRAA